MTTPRGYSDQNKKKLSFLICSIFMSFSPIELIFIGWVGDIMKFFGYSEISILNPQTRYFQKKGKFLSFQKVCFWRVWPQKLSLSKIGVIDMSYIMDSGLNTQYTTFPNIFSLISAESADLSHNQKNHI